MSNLREIDTPAQSSRKVPTTWCPRCNDIPRQADERVIVVGPDYKYSAHAKCYPEVKRDAANPA